MSIEHLHEKSDPIPQNESIQRQTSLYSNGPRYIIKFISAEDIPVADFRGTNPFVRAYLSITAPGHDGIYELKQLGKPVVTPKKLDCTAVTWNCYRDFRLDPSPDAILVVELLHYDNSTSDQVLGNIHIPISTLENGEVNTSYFINQKNDRRKNPKFSIKLQRVWIHDDPPRRKTFFLIRHGQSKWNEAQARINIGGMLDRDHALTELGIQQAEGLNERWKEFYETRHNESKNISSKQQLPPPVESEKDFSTGNLLDGYDDDVPPQSQPQAISFPAEYSGFDFMNDELPLVPAPLPNTEVKGQVKCYNCGNMGHNARDCFVGAPVHSRSASDESLDDTDINESIIRFTESFNVSESDKAINFGGSKDGREDEDEDEDDEVFEERLKRLSLSRNHGKSLPVLVPDAIDETDEPESIPAKNRLSSSADDLLRDLHSSKLQLQGEDKNIEKRRKEYMKLFLCADRVYSSPLTRALETAVVSMEGHRAIRSSGITLYSVIREIKKLGGLDTVGIEHGEAILKRLRSELSQTLDQKRIDSLLDISVDINDADQPWWTSITSNERTPEQQERVREFLTFVRYCDSKLPVFVGHSLFFKAFYSKRISNELLMNRQSLSENLKNFRLSNASILAVTVKFDDVKNGQSDAYIIDADLIFGGGFHGAPDETDNHETTANTSSIFDSPLKLASSFESSGQNIHQVFQAMNSKEFQANIQQELKQKSEAISKGVKKLSEKLFDLF